MRTDLASNLQTHKETNEAVHMARYALVIEPFPCMAIVLQELGWKCDAYHPRSMIEACSQQVGGWIRDGKYQFLWIRFPWKSILPQKRLARFEQMSNSWLHLAGSCSILAVHCKQASKYSWNHDESFIVDKFTSEHHLCHFGIRLVGEQPSSVFLPPADHQGSAIA